MASGKHRKPKDSSSTRRTVAVCLGASVASPAFLATQAQAAPVSAWDRIAECESNGRWNLPYGDNGKSSGGLQFQPGSWSDALAKLRTDGIDTSAFPQGSGHQAYKATKNQQILAGEALLKLQGPRAWTCNAKTGGPLNGYSGGDYAPYLSHAAPAPRPTKPVVPVKPKPLPPQSCKAWAHTVVRGDTLYGITKTHTGNGARDNWKRVWANNDHIKNPHLIFPGQKVVFPCKPGWKAKPSAPVSPPPPSTPVSSVVAPVDARVSQVYGNRSGGYTLGYHTGVDYAAPHGAAVKAVKAGTVVLSDPASAYGINVLIRHDDGKYTLYAHLSAKLVSHGQRVAAGQLIGRVGNTGTNSSGPHLHFEVRLSPKFGAGNFLDPLTWLRSQGA